MRRNRHITPKNFPESENQREGLKYFEFIKMKLTRVLEQDQFINDYIIRIELEKKIADFLMLTDMSLHKSICVNGMAGVRWFLNTTSTSVVGSPLDYKLQAYLMAKNKYTILLSKYDVFKEKEKSVEYAANVVGLQTPRMKRSNS